nr:TniB family NTP-binding protein [uncultured Rhodopila sp.]
MTDFEADIAARQARLAKVYVSTPKVKEAIKLIDDVRTGENRPSGGVMCGVITADSGWGKSMILDRYAARADAQPDGVRLPVVKFKMPPRFSFPALAVAALKAVGAKPFPRKETFDDMWERFAHYLKEKQTEVILIDESNHLVDRKSRQAVIPYSATDVFKSDILDEAKVPIIFAGLPVTLEMFQMNPQLESRRHDTVSIVAYDADDVSSWQRFKVLIMAFEIASGFGNAVLSEDDGLLRRLHVATNGGNHNAVYKLLVEATGVAVRRQSKGFNQDVLATAAAKRADLRNKDWVNPFTVDNLSQIARMPDESRVTTLHKKSGRKLLGARK